MMISTLMTMYLTFRLMRSNIERKGGENMDNGAVLHITLEFDTEEQAKQFLAGICETNKMVTSGTIVADRKMKDFEYSNGELVLRDST